MIQNFIANITGRNSVAGILSSFQKHVDSLTALSERKLAEKSKHEDIAARSTLEADLARAQAVAADAVAARIAKLIEG